MSQVERRKEQRIKLRIMIQYERVLSEGAFDIPVTTPIRDISMGGVSFYSVEKLDINSKVRITIYVSDRDYVSFQATVIKVMHSAATDGKFIIATKMDSLKQETVDSIESFLNKVNLYNILDNIDLENVMDVNFVTGYDPVIKKIGRLVIGEGRDPFDEYTLRTILLSILDDDRYNKFLATKELNFVLTSPKGSRFRVNYHIQQDKVEGTFRVIPSQIKSPSGLGLPEVVEHILENEKGLVLVAGRTGSGKSTTLAAMVEFINRKRDGIIISVEDPIEYLHVNDRCIIKQREIGRDTLSFSNAAKNALRQNPDILVIGEILDVETMETAITAAETGALVLTTIHAGDASQTLDRVISFFPADVQRHILTRLSLILKGVIVQDLIPRLDNAGLVVASEVVVSTSAVRRVIRDGDWKQIPSLIQMGREVGMRSMKDSLEYLYLNGLIDKEYSTRGDTI